MSNKFVTPPNTKKNTKPERKRQAEPRTLFHETPSGVNAMSQFATPELSQVSQGSLSNSPVTSLSIRAPQFPHLSPGSSRGTTPMGTPDKRSLYNFVASNNNNEVRSSRAIPRRRKVNRIPVITPRQQEDMDYAKKRF